MGIAFDRDTVRVAVSDISATVLAERRAEASREEALDVAIGLSGDALAEAAMAPDRLVGTAVAASRPFAGVAGELSRRLESPVTVEDAAHLAAIAELACAASQGLHDVVYVHASWAVSAGVMIDGELYQGSSGLAGDLGAHAIGDRPLAAIATAGALLDALRPTVLPGLTLPRLQRLVATGHREAVRAVGDAGEAVGQALALLCNALNPAAIIVGGELASPTLLDGIRAGLDRHALRAVSGAAAVAAGTLGERAPVLGALQRAIAAA
jgi:predicted NBD/HSP70 family sugar kinase